MLTPDRVSEVVTQVVAGRALGRPRASGTAVFVAPGVALAARHVADDFTDRFGVRTPAGDSTQQGYGVQLEQTVNLPPHRIHWDVHYDSGSYGIDVTVLTATHAGRLPAEYQWPYATVRLGGPTKGETVVVLGYGRSEVNADESAGGWILTHTPMKATGTVTEIYNSGLGTMKPFPCFQIEAQTECGMSGGPIFDEQCNLCGILSTGLDVAPGDTPLSFGAILWPACALYTEKMGGLKLADLMQKGSVRVADPDWIDRALERIKEV